MVGNPLRRALLGAGIGASIATPSVARPPAAPTPAALAALVRAQADEIADLRRRLAAVEARQAGTPPAAVVATAPAPTPAQVQQRRVDAEVAAATRDTRDDDIAALRTQVAQLAAQPHGVTVDWSAGGPTFASPDGFFTFHPGGRIVADASTTSGSRYHDRNISGTEFRDLRLEAEGTIGRFGYDLDVDFAGNAVSVKEAYLAYETRIAGVGSKTYVGNSLNDRSLEGTSQLVSIPFAERNAVASVAAPQIGYFGLGLQERVFGKGWHVSAAVKGGDNGDNDGTHDDTIAYFGRAHVNPILSRDAFVHIGGWGYHENLDKTRATVNKTSVVASDFNQQARISASSIANVTSDDGYGAEVGAGWHGLWAFAEYGQRTLHVAGVAPDVTQKAWSAYGGWFLTGEKVPYAARSALFLRPNVVHPVGAGGLGGFELLARYDDYDFDDAPRGGTGHAETVGANWFLTDFFDFKLNYIRWHTDNKVGTFTGKDNGNTVLLRGEVVF